MRHRRHIFPQSSSFVERVERIKKGVRTGVSAGDVEAAAAPLHAVTVLVQRRGRETSPAARRDVYSQNSIGCYAVFPPANKHPGATVGCRATAVIDHQISRDACKDSAFMRQANTHAFGESSCADEEDVVLRAAVQLAEGGESGTRNDCAKGLAGGSRSLVIVQWYARQDPLQHVIRQRLKGGASHRWSCQLGGSARTGVGEWRAIISVRSHNFTISFEPMRHARGAKLCAKNGLASCKTLGI